MHGCARDEEELRGAGRILAAAVPRARFVPHVCDVRDQDAVSVVVDDVVRSDGGVDAAVHVAGVIQVGHADAMTLGHYHDAVDTMLWGPVHLALAVLPMMRDAGHGRIEAMAAARRASSSSIWSSRAIASSARLMAWLVRVTVANEPAEAG